MEVIPAINEVSFKEVKKKLKQVQDFGANPVNGASWAHLDVADGKFTRHISWNKPKELEAMKGKYRVNIEVHLMVENADKVLDEWLDAKVKRIIIHLESANDIDVMKMKCVAFGAELIIAVNPDTSVERLFSHSGDANGFLILAVPPGLSGQKFREEQLNKIKILRQKLPDVKIIVDGGVNLENAKKIKEAGADILVSASYIWDNENPKEAYQQFKNI